MAEGFELPDYLRDDEVIAEIYVHVIYWTRDLAHSLSPEMLARAQEEMDQAMFTVEGESLAAGGAANHLHVLTRMSPNHPVTSGLDAMRDRLAALAASQGNKEFTLAKEDLAVSISPEEIGKARQYINSQPSHHEHVTFESELKAVFDEHGFPWDEKELWK